MSLGSSWNPSNTTTTTTKNKNKNFYFINQWQHEVYNIKEYSEVWYSYIKNAVGEKSRHLGRKIIFKQHSGDTI